jgi:hypothetical protein
MYPNLCVGIYSHSQLCWDQQSSIPRWHAQSTAPFSFRLIFLELKILYLFVLSWQPVRRTLTPASCSSRTVKRPANTPLAPRVPEYKGCRSRQHCP